MSFEELKSKIESLIFIATKPVSFKQITQWTKANFSEVKEAIKELIQEYSQENRGIQIIQNNNQIQMVSSPENAQLVQDFLKDEMTGELTQPALETLTIIAYQGPMTKYTIEQIRGVNCSLILRNLMIKGLVEISAQAQDGFSLYNITFDFLHYLGVKDVRELPDYEKMRQDENLEKLLEKDNKELSQESV